MATHDDTTRRMRQADEALAECLDQLDKQTDKAAADDVRSAERYRYRVRALLVEMPQGAGEWVRYSVPSRNISEQGVSFLIGHFVYPGTPCRVHLVTVQNDKQANLGTVARCRYVPGTRGVHEVGVRFTDAVDVEMFHRGAGVMKLLLADDDPGVRKLVQRLLQSNNVQVTCVANGREAVEAVLAEPFDVVVMDVEMPEMNGIEAARTMREKGFARPIIAATALSDAESRSECLQAGFNLWIAKPFSRAALVNTIMSMKEDPLVSSLAHDPELTDLIDDFVNDLPERVRALEVAFQTQDNAALAKEARTLKGGGGMYGFAPITEAAEALEATVTDGADSVKTRQALNQLTRLCLAARPATRHEHAAHPEAEPAETKQDANPAEEKKDPAETKQDADSAEEKKEEQPTSQTSA